MQFNNTTFESALGTYNSTDLVLQGPWVPWQGYTGRNNEVLQYTYNTQSYRTWNQESSQTNVPITSLNLGLMVSCKLDCVRSKQDDHIIILVGFMLDNNLPKICFAQALVEFTDGTAPNINTGPIASGDISQGIYDAINNQTHGQGTGRSDFPYIAKANIDCIVASVS